MLETYDLVTSLFCIVYSGGCILVTTCQPISPFLVFTAVFVYIIPIHQRAFINHLSLIENGFHLVSVWADALM